jgi:hypothetical protein
MDGYFGACATVLLDNYILLPSRIAACGWVNGWGWR